MLLKRISVINIFVCSSHAPIILLYQPHLLYYSDTESSGDDETDESEFDLSSPVRQKRRLPRRNKSKSRFTKKSVIAISESEIESELTPIRPRRNPKKQKKDSDDDDDGFEVAESDNPRPKIQRLSNGLRSRGRPVKRQREESDQEKNDIYSFENENDSDSQSEDDITANKRPKEQKEDSTLSKRKPRVKKLTWQDYLPTDWITKVAPSRFPYVPQLQGLCFGIVHRNRIFILNI